MDTHIARYRRWFEFEQDAHAKTIASLRAAERTHAAAPDFQKAVDLSAHIVAARKMWLWRLGVLPGPPAGGAFPTGTRVEDVATAFTEMHTMWTAWFAQAGDEVLAREVEYTAMTGAGFRSTVEDILTQLFHHSAYHRGQVAQLLRRVGAEPAPTDFVFWSRSDL